MSQSPILLLTRPEAQAKRFARQASARLGPAVQVVIAPLIAIRPRPLERDPAEFAGFVFTSENGVAAFAAQSALRDRPVWCVGTRTAKAAREAGFTTVQSAAQGGGDAEALFRSITEVAPPVPLLHLRGVHSRGDLAPRLAAHGLPCEAAVVYDQVALPLTQKAIDLLRGTVPVLLPLFSPRTAGLMAERLRDVEACAPLHVVAISPAAAVRWQAARAEPVEVAARPDAAAVLAVIERIARTLVA